MEGSSAITGIDLTTALGYGEEVCRMYKPELRLACAPNSGQTLLVPSLNNLSFYFLGPLLPSTVGVRSEAGSSSYCTKTAIHLQRHSVPCHPRPRTRRDQPGK